MTVVRKEEFKETTKEVEQMEEKTASPLEEVIRGKRNTWRNSKGRG